MRLHGWELLLLIGIAPLTSGCPAGATAVGPDTGVVSDEATLVSIDAAWDFVVVDPVTNATLFPVAPAVFDPAAAAAEATAAAGTLFTPPSCVQASSSGGTVTYVLQNCAGPISLAKVTGTVTATFAANTAGPQVEISSTGLTVDGTPVTLAQTATISMSGNMVTLDVVTNTLIGNMPPNSRSLRLTVAWTPGMACLLVSGSGTEVVSKNTFSVTVNSFQQCNAQCPTSGSVVSAIGSTATTLTFNGSNKAEATDSTGNSEEVPLTCP